MEIRLIFGIVPKESFKNMAWRIDSSVVRGEIDNRQKGVVRGRLWLAERAEPIILELQGNACADVAGCLLTFENPEEAFPDPHLKKFLPLQKGTVGNISASQKVRVFDVDLEEAQEMLSRGEKPPEHVANSFYFEWFTEENGRVVIESVHYRIQISPPAWSWTKEDEAERAALADDAWNHFSEKLSRAIEAERSAKPENLEDWDEFDFERSLREGDALTNKYMELLDKYGDDPEKEDLIAKEMGWLDEDEDDEAEEFRAENVAAFLEKTPGSTLDVDEINRICEEALESPPEPDPATEGIDWIRVKDGGLADIRHPLQHRCFQSAMKLWEECDELGLLESNDESLHQLISQFQTAGAKLAGALNSLAYGRDTHEPAFIVAYLKRALSHLHQAQGGLEEVSPKKILPEKTVIQTRRELFAIREEILHLMQEFRS